MIRRLLEQEDEVRVILSSDRKSTQLVPTWQDIQKLQSLSKALSPAAEFIDFLSGNKHATISSILLVLHNLSTKVLKIEEEDTQLIHPFKVLQHAAFLFNNLCIYIYGIELLLKIEVS